MGPLCYNSKASHLVDIGSKTNDSFSSETMAIEIKQFPKLQAAV